MNAAEFGAALDHAAHAPERAAVATVRIHFVSSYRQVTGIAVRDTGLHGGALPALGANTGGDVVWQRDRTYPHPGDGLARTIASGFKLGDRISFKDPGVTSKGFRYGITLQTPEQRVALGFPAGTKPAGSPQAPQGDYGLVYQEELDTFYRDLKIALRREEGWK